MTTNTTTTTAKALELARQQGRNEAYEECAQVAEYWASGRKPRYGGHALRNCAVALRSLIVDMIPSKDVANG